MRRSYASLHPAALAIAAGFVTLILALLGGFGMMGSGSMMGGGTYGMAPGYRMTFSGGVFVLLSAGVVGAVGGFLVAVIYNAVVRQAEAATGEPEPRDA